MNVYVDHIVLITYIYQADFDAVVKGSSFLVFVRELSQPSVFMCIVYNGSNLCENIYWLLF